MFFKYLYLLNNIDFSNPNYFMKIFCTLKTKDENSLPNLCLTAWLNENETKMNQISNNLTSYFSSSNILI